MQNKALPEWPTGPSGPWPRRPRRAQPADHPAPFVGKRSPSCLTCLWTESKQKLTVNAANVIDLKRDKEKVEEMLCIKGRCLFFHSKTLSLIEHFFFIFYIFCYELKK